MIYSPAQKWVLNYLYKHRLTARQLSRNMGCYDGYVSNFTTSKKPPFQAIFKLHQVVRFPDHILDDAHKAQADHNDQHAMTKLAEKTLWRSYVASAIKNPSPIHWPIVR